jgi:transposase
MDMRQIRGLEIAERGFIKKVPKGWQVLSQTGPYYHLVKKEGENMSCSCPDFTTRGVKCKHIFAVEQHIQSDGRRLERIEPAPKIKKRTYAQNWKAYTSAQTSEWILFDTLLEDLVEGVEEPEQRMGRPRLRMKDLFFCSVQKVYSQLSSRRARSLYTEAGEMERIAKAPNYNAINMFLNREDITPRLENLLSESAMPLRSVETCFAQDSSGFSTSRFSQYYVQKYGGKQKHTWMKAHILTGTKTNVIVCAKVTGVDGGDSPMLRPMVKEAAERGYCLEEVSADKAYSSRDNLDAIREAGGTPYIPFKISARDNARGSFYWTKMYHYFMLNREEFMQHYHRRSNVETTFMMIKAKFGDHLKSKNETAQRNELLCKLIAHNIVVLIHEMHELGVTPHFQNTI